jgi:hypothetical protein
MRPRNRKIIGLEDIEDIDNAEPISEETKQQDKIVYPVGTVVRIKHTFFETVHEGIEIKTTIDANLFIAGYDYDTEENIVYHLSRKFVDLTKELDPLINKLVDGMNPVVENFFLESYYNIIWSFGGNDSLEDILYIPGEENESR